MELKHFHVPVDCRGHLVVWLIADDVVDQVEMRGRQRGEQRIVNSRFRETGQERARVVAALNERVDGVAVLSVCQ